VEIWNSEDVQNKISQQLISCYIQQQYFDGLYSFLYCQKQDVPTLVHPLQLGRRNLKRNTTYWYLNIYKLFLLLFICIFATYYVHIHKPSWDIVISCTDFLQHLETIKFLGLIQHVFTGERL
jgi:hypothetical protein